MVIHSIYYRDLYYLHLMSFKNVQLKEKVNIFQKKDNKLLYPPLHKKPFIPCLRLSQFLTTARILLLFFL